MKTLFLSSLLTLLLTENISAQTIFQHDTTSTRLERFEYVLGGTVAFSLLDYFGINLARQLGMKNEGLPNDIYHAAMGAVAVALNYWLYTKLGLPSVIAFDLLWWSWTDDLGYMAWANVLNLPSPWPNRTTEQFTENICCAEWTPVGILQGYREFLPRSTIFGQSAVGLAVALAILW